MDLLRAMKVVRAAVTTPGLRGRMGLPVLLWGAVGIGKSQELEKTVRDLGLHPEVIIAALREPTDFGGLPVPVQQNGRVVVEHSPPAWAAKLPRDSVVILDELSSTPPATQAALLRMVLEGKLGEFEFSGSVRFLGIANPVEEAAGGWELARPLVNRFGHIDVDSPNAEEWSSWLLRPSELGIEYNPTPGTCHVEVDEWLSCLENAKKNVAGFIRAKPNLLNVSNEAKARAFPTPRTWEMATRAYGRWLVDAGLNENDYSEAAYELLRDLVGAFVGIGAALEFVEHVLGDSLPDPNQVLCGPTIDFTKLRADRVVAILDACAKHVVVMRSSALEGIFVRLLDKISSEIAADLVVPSMRILANAKMNLSSPTAVRVIERIQPFIGIDPKF